MMRIKIIIAAATFYVMSILMTGFLFASGELLEEKSKHFIVEYESEISRNYARKVLRSAENYYRKIASQIGYARYQKFWTWNDRAKIIIFANQKNFIRETGLPAWSSGGATRDTRLFQSRMIVTFFQEQEFLEGILPHEISHLILRDFIGFEKKIPVWFDEGVAQLQDRTRRDLAKRIMGNLVRMEIFVPLKLLNQYDIRFEKDPSRVGLFYAQSFSLVDYLIRYHGSYKFGQLCRRMSEGKSFEEALTNTYPAEFQSMKAFEEKWLRYMKNE